MTKIMKSNGGHVMLLKNGWYMRGQISRLDQFSKFIRLGQYRKKWRLCWKQAPHHEQKHKNRPGAIPIRSISFVYVAEASCKNCFRYFAGVIPYCFLKSRMNWVVSEQPMDSQISSNFRFVVCRSFCARFSLNSRNMVEKDFSALHFNNLQRQDSLQPKC